MLKILDGSTDISNAYVGILTAQAQDGDIKGALNIAKKMKDYELKSETLTLIAQVQTQEGDIEGATKTIQEALNTADNINDVFDKCARLIRIADSQAQSGDCKGALHTLEKALFASQMIEDEFFKNLSLKNIAMATALLGNYHKAYDTAYTIDDGQFSSEALRFIKKIKQEKELNNE
jgi:tetratricopeptide (TPR) repeat protein